MAAAAYNVDEGDALEVCVELTNLPGKLQWEIVVNLDVIDGPKAGTVI